MRQITKDAVAAFYAGRDFSRSNTQVFRHVVTDTADGAVLYLHGNLIAKRCGPAVYVRDAGWQSNTTKERLNGVYAGKHGATHAITQRDGVWYLVGQEFDSLADENGWVTI